MNNNLHCKIINTNLQDSNTARQINIAMLWVLLPTYTYLNYVIL